MNTMQVYFSSSTMVDRELPFTICPLIVVEIKSSLIRVTMRAREIINIHKNASYRPLIFEYYSSIYTGIFIGVFACYRPSRFDNKSKF